jgi:hypothetical protein
MVSPFIIMVGILARFPEVYSSGDFSARFANSGGLSLPLLLKWPS